jgi:glycolate oxidase iron-sulfur subunit
MHGLFGHVNDATARVLLANGIRVAPSPGQHCCGALHAHAGDLEGAQRLARLNIAAFETALENGVDVIAINSAGCGAMIKGYGHLLHDDAAWSARAQRVASAARDISELLAESGPRRGGNVALRVTHDPPCHQMHAQRVVRQPIAVLNGIPGLELVPLEDADQCCGSAGIYNLVEPDTSDAVLAPKLARIAETGAEYVATGNPGCMMQIGAGLLPSGSAARGVHPVELLDASYRAARESAP